MMTERVHRLFYFGLRFPGTASEASGVYLYLKIPVIYIDLNIKRLELCGDTIVEV
jgi:hypothetical protein